MGVGSGVRAEKIGRRRGVWTAPRAFAVAAAISVIISFTAVFDHSVWTPDEPRDAEVGREMWVSGDFLVPTLAQKPFLEKPPLGWWPMAGLYSVLGKSDGVARTSSALAGVLTLLLVFDVVRRIADPFAALMATLAAGTLSGFFFEYHRTIVDPWLSLFVMLGYWGYVLAMSPPPDAEEKGIPTWPPPNLRTFAPSRLSPCPWAIGIIYLAGGLSFLVKGPVGPGLIAGPILIFIVAGRQWGFFRSWMHVPGALVFLALCAFWPWVLYRRGGSELMNGFLRDSVYDRFFPPARELVKTGHVEKWYYYLVNFPASIMPWLIAVPAIGHWLWRKRVPWGWNRSALVFLAWVFPIGLVLLSAAGTKRGLYLLPVVAPFGAVAGAWIAAVVKDEQPHRIDRYTLMILVGVLVLIAAAALVGPVVVQLAPRLAPGNSVVLLIYRIPRLNLLFLQIVGGIFLLVSIYGISLLRRGRPRVAALAAWMAFGMTAAGAPMVYNSVDEFKNLHRFTADLVRMNAFSPELITYGVDETTLGVIPYDTGHYLKEFDDPEQFDRYLQQNPAAKLLVLKKRYDEVLPESLRARVYLVKRWEFGGHRIYELYDLRAPHDPDSRER